MALNFNNLKNKFLPLDSKYFVEEAINKILSIPDQKPDIERILNIDIIPEIIDFKIVETAQSTSFEGQKLTGIKLSVNILLHEKLTYVAKISGSPLHATDFSHYVTLSLNLPEYLEDISVFELINVGRISLQSYVEYSYAKLISSRNIHSSLLLFLDAKVS